ncbi:MAG: TorF family putative porin [SAR86 cluster bacterium]|nr:TorF family putative porin [SAR86 cluster bacterium]MDG1722180.1 TorF family putative porin [SAR86 cluster bacterium]|tara:strand:- start:311 stop:910 length:600 start_codon:yes stop_codon:yes gene_type:complete
MNKFLTILLTGFIAVPGFAGVSANVAFASDYIWRGMTQTGSDPALSGGFDFESESGFYAGIWGSNVSFSEGAGSELDTYFGYGFSLGEVGVDLSYVDFGYPGDSGLDFQEIGVALSYGDFGVGYYSGQDGAPDYMDLSYSMGDFSVSYGDYDTYGTNFALGYGFACGEYDCGLTYSDFSSDSVDLMDEDALVFSVSASF